MSHFSIRLTKPALWASPHTSHAPAQTTLDSSVWHNIYCPREPKPGTALQMCPWVPKRGTSPSPLPAGPACAGTVQQERPAFNATRTRSWRTFCFQRLANPSMQSAPSLSSCTAVTTQRQDQNLTTLSCRVPWTHGPIPQFISHCPPSQLPAQTCWGCTGASLSLKVWRIPLRNKNPIKV